jgi:hypothetical protein
MKCAVGMDSGAIIYIPNFIKIDSGFKGFVCGGEGYTYRHSGIQTHTHTGR